MFTIAIKNVMVTPLTVKTMYVINATTCATTWDNIVTTVRANPVARKESATITLTAASIALAVVVSVDITWMSVVAILKTIQQYNPFYFS